MPATNLYNSISAAWDADEVLNALVPSTQVFNDRTENTNIPYATIKQVVDQKSGRSSKAWFWEEQFQIDVRCENLSIARRVQKEFRRVLDAMVPTLDDGTLIRWERLSGGRSTEEGAVGRAMDVYLLEKETNR